MPDPRRRFADIPAALLRFPIFLAVFFLGLVLGAVPLIAWGQWRPSAAVPVVLLAAFGAWWAVRAVPAAPMPGRSGWAIVALAVLGGSWAAATHSEHIVLRRDAGSYAQFAHQLATAHSARVDVRWRDLGGLAAQIDTQSGPDAERGVTVGSPGFYAQGRDSDLAAIPQFLIGTPVVLSLAWWLGGWQLLLLLPALVYAAALLAGAGLALRLIGPRGATLVTALLACCLPMLHTARSTYSELFALLFTMVAFTLLVEALRVVSGNRFRHLAALAGLLLAGGALFRVDALREVALCLPVVAFLALRKPILALRLLAGLATATGLAMLTGAALSRPYLQAISDSLGPLLLFLAGSALLSCLGYFICLCRPIPRIWLMLNRRVRSRFLPGILAALVLGVGVVLASRPLWSVARPRADDPIIPLVATWQAEQGLAVDGNRNYGEESLTWVSWWLGWPAVLLAGIAASALAWRLGARLLAGRALPDWTGLLMIAGGSTVLTLLRPAITPDHPWADRRLVPMVLPTVCLLAVLGLGLILGRVSRWRGRRWAIAGGAVGTLLLLGPTLAATLPLAGQRTERGGLAAVNQACSGLADQDTVLLVDNRAANEWTQVLRGMCGVPSVVVRDLTAVARVSSAIKAAGRHPVLIAGDSPQSLTRLGAQAEPLVFQRSTDHQRLLVRRPTSSVPLRYQLWRAEVPGALVAGPGGPVPSGST